MRRLLVLLLTATACAPTPVRRATAVRARPALSGWTDGRLTVVAPYDAARTGAWGRALAEELERLRRLLDVPPPDALGVRLAPVPVGNAHGHDVLDTLEAARVGRDFVGGYVRADGTVVVHVPERDGAPALTIAALRPTLRHELAHVLLRGAELPRARWLEEGLASLLETLPVDADGRAVWDGVVARRTLSARALDPSLGWSALRRWTSLAAHEPRDRAALAREARRYALATSLVEYGLRGGRGTFARRLERFLEIEPAWIERDWLDWLAGLDVVADVARALEAPDPALRAAAAARLARLVADPRFGELRTERADRLAAAALSDPATTAAAQRFLVMGRARALGEETLRALEASPEPLVALTAQAVRRQRGLDVDRGRVETAWAGLDEAARAGALTAARVLGLPR